MTSFAIEAKSLNKTFKTRTGFWQQKTKVTTAVEDVSFSVGRGELFGLLGPNGAGKTTTVKMLSTLLLPSGGAVSILGLDVVKQTLAVRKRIGFTFGGARGLYGRLSANDNLRYFAELYELEPALTRKRVPQLLELVGLSGRGDDRVETFSSGMQQRLHLARALLHDPEVIFLDEPTVGIDPVGARELRKTIKELVSRGKTILLTTHYMAEAEELCDRIAIIKKGRIIALDSPSALKQQINADTLIDLMVRADKVSSLMAQIQTINCCSSMELDDAPPLKKITLHTPDPGRVMQNLAPFLTADVIQCLEVRNQTLEDVYVAIIQGGEE